MTYKVCDRCGNSIPRLSPEMQWQSPAVTLAIMDKEHFGDPKIIDLCWVCRKELVKWIEGGKDND